MPSTRGTHRNSVTEQSIVHCATHRIKFPRSVGNGLTQPTIFILRDSILLSYLALPISHLFILKRSERWIESRGTLRICWKLEETSQVFLGKLLTKKHWQIAVWLLRPRANKSNVYTFWKISYEMNMMFRSIKNYTTKKIIIFVPCSTCIARNLFVAAMLLSIRLGVS